MTALRLVQSGVVEMNFEERVEIMSHNDPEQIKNKWEKTGLLDKLDDEMAYKISQLCENQARHLLFTYSNDELNNNDRNARLLSNICLLLLQLIRRIFGDPEELTFTFETSVVPAFLYAKESEKDKDGRAATVHYHDYESSPNREEVMEVVRNGVSNLDGEILLTDDLSERFKNELNEKHAGKHLIFGYPFEIKETEEGEEKIVYRCAVVDGGSRLVAGQFRRAKNE